MKANQQSISQKIQKLCTMSKYSSGPKQVIDDMVQLAFNLMTTPIFLDHFPRSRYYVDHSMRNEVRRYEHDPEAWKLLQELVVDFMRAIKEAQPFEDVMGSFYDEYLGQALGQFLTPKDVADALAAIQLALMDKPTEKLVIGDPCGCGAGSLVLAQLRGILDMHGEDIIKLLEVVVMDLDPNMVRLCTVQIVMSSVMHNIPIFGLEAHCGNTITDYSPRPGSKPTLSLRWLPVMSKEEYFEADPQVQALNKLMKVVTEGERDLQAA